ncbi:hypothetical protein AB0M32_29775 [Streptomyces sp. NPDC051985]|uniref:hypothetical protein n=1 Tax=Streptomyces sp. NPDC051985 TaxID=3155807 RepID=UPI00341EDBE3
MDESSGPRSDTWRLRSHSERAFAEVQRADTKATVTSGIAGGLLGAGAALLSSADGIPLIAISALVLMCLSSMVATGAALLALRPVIPRSGLRSRLMAEADVQLRTDAGTAARAEFELSVETRRLLVFGQLADRKLRAVRLAVDLTLTALFMAGTALLSWIVIG